MKNVSGKILSLLLSAALVVMFPIEAIAANPDAADMPASAENAIDQPQDQGDLDETATDADEGDAEPESPEAGVEPADQQAAQPEDGKQPSGDAIEDSIDTETGAAAPSTPQDAAKTPSAVESAQTPVNGASDAGVSFEAQASNDGTEVRAALSADQRIAWVSATGGAFAQASEASFPTWSAAGGQDDLVWYAGYRVPGGWAAMVDVSRHATAGTYYVDAYAARAGAPASYQGGATFTVASPRAKVTVSRADPATGAFSVEVKVDSPSGVAAVDVPVWFDAGGQDDLVWHRASRTPSGAWRVDTGMHEHLYQAGSLNAHVYVTCGNGVRAAAGAARGTASLGPATVRAALSADQRIAWVSATGGAFAQASEASFPTWSAAGGQDDLVWYAGYRVPGGWAAMVDVSRHATAGTYYVDAYAARAGGPASYQGGATFAVASPRATVKVQDSSNGGFTVVATVTNVPSGMRSVKIPTWTAQNGQDDIIYYDGASQGSNVYAVRVEAGAHGFQEGAYLSHVYVTTGNGITQCVGIASSNVACRNYVYMSGAPGSGHRTVYVKNPAYSNAVGVPTWSDEGGQDDLVWYSAVNQGNGLWVANIDTIRFKHSGRCTSHVYIGNGSVIKVLNFTVTPSEVGLSGDYALDSYLQSIIERHGTDLNTLYWYVVGYPYIHGSTYPSGEWSIPFAKEMYENGGGNCYRYAALFCWLARAVGYDANVVAGECPSRSRGRTAHGWVEIHIDGVTYVCDPDMQQGAPGYNWFMRPYWDAPMEYYR